MPVQVHPDQTTEWQLEKHKGDPDSPVFILGPLTGFEAAGLFAKHQAIADGDTDAAGRCYEDTIRAGLRGWRNVFGADGKPVEFQANPKGRPKAESLAVIARDWITVYGMADAILGNAMMTKADLGNSKPAS